MSALSPNPSPNPSPNAPAAAARRLPGALGALLLGAALLGGCAGLPRDINGSPPTARLVPNSIPPAPITPEESQKLGTLNRDILREQDAAIARQQQAEAYARAYSYYAYPSPSWNLYYGGWGGRHWGGGVGFSSGYGYPGWGWGGYPYWW
ncbi:hypothetical protein [Cupriavidus basilensis]|uniref:hypothetical protein n=1 Tax=Cupriavidus basilensis TaxID=68895 RepID=UPI0007519BBB|nr:hypothetical protein [Cupriavidus basilensis]